MSRELNIFYGGGLEFTSDPMGPSSGSIPNNVEDNYSGDGEQGSGCYGYSRPLLFLDMIWNLAFVLVSVVVLLTTFKERPSTPLRLWVFGYALQCLLHAWCVWDEYQRRGLDAGYDDDDGLGGRWPNFDFFRLFSFFAFSHDGFSIIKKMDSVITILSPVWWVFGFYWILLGGQPLLRDSPRLYWLSVVFLGFDVCFMVFCIIMAFVIFFFLSCCFPILSSVAYAMTLGNGASESDIRSLAKYVYRQQGTIQVVKNDEQQESVLAAPTGNSIPMAELILLPEDSECCICLHKYKDGAELCRLACNHHFHYKCITKWLRINATCPLCKFNILRGDMVV